MSKLKRWLYERFLPAWCRDDLMRANELLSENARRRPGRSSACRLISMGYMRPSVANPAS